MSVVEIRLSLGPDTRAPAAARRALRGRLERLVEPDVLERATLLVSERVTNSVIHAGLEAGDEIELSVRASPVRLHVEVGERGEGFDLREVDRPRPGDPAGGWGLFLVDRLSSAWGVSGDGATRVWFEVETEPETRAG